MINNGILDQQEKPETVKVACNVLYVVFLFEIILLVFKQASLELPWPFLAKILGQWIIILVPIFVYKVSKGSSWARTALLVILLINLPIRVISAYIGKFEVLVADPQEGFLLVMQMSLYVIAMMMLFENETNEWFRHRKVFLSQERGKRGHPLKGPLSRK